MSVLWRPIFGPIFRPLTSAVTDVLGGGFAVGSLYAAAQDGGVYDWSSIANTYQDSGGTTAGVVGQVDGLTLDGRLGYALGAELVTNGAFTTDTTGWAANGGSTIAAVGGELKMSVTAGGMDARQTIATTSGKTYRVTARIRCGQAVGACRMSVVGKLDGVQVTALTATAIELVFVATSSSHVVTFNTVNGNGDYYADDISTKLLDGNHATQGTTASKPTLQAGYASLDAFDDFMAATSGGGGTTGILLCAGIRAGSAGSARTIWSDRGTNTGYRLSVDASNNLILSAGNGTAHTTVTGPTITAGTDYVVMGWHDGTNLNVRVGLAAATSAAFATATAGTASFTIGRDNGTAAGNYGDRIYCLAYRKNDTSTSAQRDGLSRWAAAKSNVTL